MPLHADARLPLWAKVVPLAVLTVAAVLWVDAPLAAWARTYPFPDLARQVLATDKANAVYRGGDAGRELMFLEQWGQGVCSVAAVLAVGLLDRAGRRRALAVGLACLTTVLVTHLLKDLVGRSRPFVVSPEGFWQWGGPKMGFTKGSRWGSFPSAHTTGAFALSAALSWCYPRGRALFMGLATITAAQRVMHTAHYLSDVLAGLAIGVGVARGTLHARLAGRLIALAPPAARGWWMQGSGGGASA
jgi:undecaprenyl-diphosphatase